MAESTSSNWQAAFNWQNAFTQTYQEFAKVVVEFAPKLAAAVILLIIGWIVARILGAIAKKLVIGLDALFMRVAKTDGASQEKIKHSYAAIANNIVFWTVMLFFIATSVNMLEWKLFFNVMENVISYLPNLITGLLIVLAGYLLSSAARTAITSTAFIAGLEQSEIIARVVQVIIILTAIIIGAGNMGINVRFLSNVIIVTFGVLLAGGALAFGLGARSLIANVIGAQYIRRHCRIGEVMKIGDIEGTILEVTQTSIILDTETGRTAIPAKRFHEQVISFNSQ